jgi:hypothetical protein
MPPTPSRNNASASVRDDHARRSTASAEFSSADVEVAERQLHPQHSRRRHLSANRSSSAKRAAPRSRLDQADRRRPSRFEAPARPPDFRFPGKGKLSIKFVGEACFAIEKEVLMRRAPAWHSPCGQPRRLDPRFHHRASPNYGLECKWPVYLSTKHPEGLCRFKDIFQEVFVAEFKQN